MRSIERTLLAWILGALSLGALVVALVTYLVTLEEMHEVFDADLKNVAQAVASYHHAGHGPGGKEVIASPQRNDTPEDSEIVTLTWTPQGQRVFASDSRVDLPFSNIEGLSRPTVQGEAWIVYSSVNDDGVAQAAQRVSARQEMAGESAGKVLPPLIGLVVIVGGLLVFGLRRGLQPLDSTAQDVARRSARALEPITLEDVPKEIKPLVASINDLMNRLAVAFATQRRFLADAAHELRTPITALRLQLQLLQRSSDEAERRQAVTDLAAGIDRSQRLVEQLLQVARSDPDGELTRREPVDLAELVRATVASLSIKAEHKGLDLGADAPDAVMVHGDANQLTVLLNNLVENALRYTPPAGGVVDVTAGLQDGRPLLRVVDNGPGVAESERERVFDRFYRCEAAQSQSGDGSGSGLGLAIVRAIAERHGAVVTLQVPGGGQGLEVVVLFPAMYTLG
ncbi:ATP-binding protein [Methylibium sp.]|jgi:signal transduction histidine kinase|uniref:ATP-binding protein n=1 Tax=Methylibium sp. TaxID=2067992 RepID=UPI003BA9513F